MVILTSIYLLASASLLFVAAAAEKSALRRDIRGANGLVFFVVMFLSTLVGILLSAYYGVMRGGLVALAGVAVVALWHFLAWHLLTWWMEKHDSRR
jgi:hypothetical protein